MSQQRLLLIDHDPKNTQFMQRSLESAGFAVETAGDGVRGLQAFERSKPELVIIETTIPEKDGFAVCRAIRQRKDGAGVRVILTSASADGGCSGASALATDQCDAYLEKPVPSDRLISICRDLLASGKAGAPAPVAAASAAAPRLDELNEDQLLAQLEQMLPDEDEEPKAAAKPAAAPPPAGPRVVSSLPDEIGPQAPTPVLMEPIDDPGDGDLQADLDALDSELDRLPSPAPTTATPSPPSAPEKTANATDAAQPVQLTEEEIIDRLDRVLSDPFSESDEEDEEDEEDEAEESVEYPRPVAVQTHPIHDPPVVGEPALEERDETSPSAPTAVALEPAPEPVADASPDEAVESTAATVAAPETPARSAPAPEETAEAAARTPAVAATKDEPRSAPRATVAPVAPPRTPSSMTIRATAQPSTVVEQTAHLAAAGVETRGGARRSRSGGILFGGAVLLLAAGAAAGWYFLRGGADSAPATVAARTETPERPMRDPFRPIAPGTLDQLSAQPAPAEPPVAELDTTSAGASRPEPGATATTAVQPAPLKPEPQPVESATQAQTQAEPEPDPQTIAVASAPGAATSDPAAEESISAAEIQFAELRPLESAPSQPMQALPVEPEPAKPIERPEPELPETVAGALVELDEVDSRPVGVQQPAPEYPAVARRLQQHGSVYLRLLIDERGRVAAVEVTGGDAGPRLTKTATDAVRRWRYRAAIKDGVRVKVWMPAKIEFAR
jgi:protein TonB